MPRCPSAPSRNTIDERCLCLLVFLLKDNAASSVPPAAVAWRGCWSRPKQGGGRWPRKRSRRPTKMQTAKKPPKKKPAKKKPRLTRVTGSDRAVPPKLADTDRQIQRLWRNVSAQCISITSSIDTTPSEMIPHEMRERWLRELRKTSVAVALLVERLAGGPTADA